jgi:peptidoglycan/LPS O-acetylase OafA/YrhL
VRQGLAAEDCSVNSERLGDVFDRHPNALNALRLVLALQVVVWHSYSLQGDDELPERLRWLASDFGVDGFFAISGLLICRAWLRRPNLSTFWLARARRILPGLWVCLVVIAFVIVPAACLVAGEPLPSLRGSVGFVVQNAGVAVHQWGIDNTTASLHDPGWNGALWTLMWEVIGYATIAVLGAAGWLRPRVVGALFVAAWSCSVALLAIGVEPYSASVWVLMPSRASIMFLAGALLWLCRDRVPLDGRLALACALAVPVGVLAVPDYRVLAGPALAYLLVWVAVDLGRRCPRLVLEQDVSYGVYIYGFPLQQALLLVGAGAVWWPAFTVLSVLVVVPVAALSWRLVEAPALRRRRSGVAADAPGRARERVAAGR